MKTNLLVHEVIKIIHENGAHYDHPGEKGMAYVAEVLAQALKAAGTDTAKATTADFRTVYHRHWDKLMELLVPADAQERVLEKFKALIF